MTPGARHGVLALAWLLTAAAFGLLGAWILRPAPEVRIREVPSPLGGTVGGSAAGPGIVSSPATIDPAAATGVPDPPRPQENPEAAISSCIEVTVLAAGGLLLPQEEAIDVYVLPAGAGGVDEIDLVPYAIFEAPGPARIPIRVPGRFDVGAVRKTEAALVQDVVVEKGATTRVTILLPRVEPATFRVEGGVPRDGELQGAVSVFASWKATALAYPGRGQVRSWSEEVKPWRLEEPARVLLPEGQEFYYHASASTVTRGPDGRATGEKPISGSNLQPSQGTVRAGETVTLRFAPPAGLRLRVRTDPPLPLGTRLEFEFLLERGGWIALGGFVAGAEDDGGPSEATHDFQSAPGPAVLRWRAGAARPGHPAVAFPPGGPVEVVLEAGRTVEVPIELKIDAGPALEALAAAVPLRLEVRGPGGTAVPASDVRVMCTRREEDGGDFEEWGSWDEFDAAGPVELTADVRAEWTHFVVFGGPGLVGDLCPLPGAEVASVELRPAGFLMAAPDAILPPEAGGLFLRRADGAPIAVSSLSEDVGRWTVDDLETRVQVHPGTLLGPLPAGTHTFEVFLGGARCGEASATVRAGRIEILRVPTR